MAKREFTGVFIPVNIWISPKLTPAEKMMCGEIDALSKNTGWCTASRAHFAEWLQCTEQNITGYWKKLERMGYIEIEKTPGKRSRIRLNQQRFWIDQPVSPTYPTRQPHLPHPSAPLTGTRQPHLPEIQDEIQDQNSSEKERARENSIPLNTEKKEAPPIPATPPAIRYNDVPKFKSPQELESALICFFAENPDEEQATKETGAMENKKRGLTFDFTTDLKAYCEWATETATMRYKDYMAHNARLRRWVRDQPGYTRGSFADKPKQQINPGSTADKFLEKQKF